MYNLTMFGKIVKVGLLLTIASAGGRYSWTSAPFDKNDPFTVGPNPAIVRTNSETQFAAYGEGLLPNDFEWRTFDPSVQISLDGLYSAGSSPDDRLIFAIGKKQSNIVVPVQVRVIPDNVAVVFISDVSGDRQLWSINEDGSGLQRLTTTGALEVMAANDDNAFYYRAPDGIHVRTYFGSQFTDGLFDPAPDSDRFRDISNRWFVPFGGAPQSATRLLFDDLGLGNEYVVLRNGLGGVVVLYRTAQEITGLAARGPITAFTRAITKFSRSTGSLKRFC